MTRLTDDALAELARLASEATPGRDRWYCLADPGVRDVSLETGHGYYWVPNEDGNSPGVWQHFADVGAYIAAADPSTVAALVAEVRALRAALAPFAEYARQFDRKPLANQHDVIHGLHIGTEWEAELTLSDCRRARRALDGAE